MKNIKLLSMSLFIGMTATTSVNAVTYYGNGNTGFGGAIGTSSLEITDDGSSLLFDLTRGSGSLTDVFVLYINSVVGGLSSNADINNHFNIQERAISGCNYTTCVDVNFGFDADYAIAFQVSSGAHLFELLPSNDLFFLSSLGGNGNEWDWNYSFNLLLSDIGVPDLSGQDIEFVGTYISPSLTSIYLSNEGYGEGLGLVNPGISPVTFSSSELYTTSAVPIPPAVWLFGSGLIGLIGIARRKKS